MVLRERMQPSSPPHGSGAILPETTPLAKPSGDRNRLSQTRRSSHVILKMLMKAVIVLLALFGAVCLFLVDDTCETADTAPKESSKPILFVHFHRSGGNAVCRSVDNSTLIVTDAEGYPQDPAQNCTTPFSHQHASPESFYRVQTCAHLLPYTMDQRGIAFRRNNLIVVGAPFFEEMPCPGHYRSFAIMRDPIDRLASHVYSEGILDMELSSWASQKLRTPSDSWMKGYPILNSMVIRQLLGQDRFVDPSPVNEKDLERAKRAVDRFDLFVPLEHLNHPNVKSKMDKTLPEISKQFYKPGKPVKSKRPGPSGQQLALMEQENKYDIMLYQYVLEKLGIED